ncbi:hypothetical protein IAT38_005721 [Cryptococcus sp. DSM 104549]
MLYWSKVLLPALVLLTEAVAFDAWHLDNLYTLATERLDPVVNPNGVSSHLHRILGGNNFGANYNSDQALASTCTTAAVQKDNSNYWLPQLFWMENNTFTPIDAGTRFYYVLIRQDDATPIKAFPPGLRMLVGNPNAKTFDEQGLPDNTAVYICQKDHFKTPNHDVKTTNFNFETDCPDGLQVLLKFPPCWDGKNLYKSDGSHMAYTDNSIYGACPVSHPVRLPAIMLEYVYRTHKLRPGVALKGNLVWANGDTTGYGLHGDFVNGWDFDVLTQALTDTRCVTQGEMTMTACPVLGAYADNAKAAACKPARGVLESYTDGVALKALPGCNKPWASGAKPTCSPAVADPSLPSALTGTDGSLVYTGSAYTSNATASATYTANGWKKEGCIGTQTTLLVNPFQYTETALTAEKCGTYCEEWGMPYMALFGGIYCQCAASYSTAANQYADSVCNTKCPGNSSQSCGGNGKTVFYSKTSVSTTVTHPNVTDSQYIGCRRDGSGVHMLNTSYVSYSPMTIDWCKTYCVSQGATLAGLEFGHACMCGNSYAGGGTPMPQSYCNLPCSGNSAQLCGGSQIAVSTFNLSLPGSISYASSSSKAVTASISSSKAATASSSSSASKASTSSAASSTSKAATSSTAASTSKASTSSAAVSTSKAATSSAAASTSKAATSTSKASSAAATSTTKVRRRAQGARRIPNAE